jgi:hypothetical protein
LLYDLYRYFPSSNEFRYSAITSPWQAKGLQWQPNILPLSFPHAVGFGASIGEEQNDRDEAIRKFKYDFEKGYLKKNKEDALKLKGKILGCHCKPLACHGDVIAEYLNSLDDGK